MKNVFYLAACFSLLGLPAHAGQGTILETDTQIIIEYSGSDDDMKAAAIQREERQKQEAAAVEKEERTKQWKIEKAARRAANKTDEEE